MKIFIISYNRLSSLRSMCKKLKGYDITIIDNNSTYPPLLEWLQNCGHNVIFNKFNGTHQALWIHHAELITDRFYCVTDPDLDISGIPDDWQDVLLRGLMENPDVVKAGFSLRLSDLPQNDYTKEVIEWESKFWQYKRKDFYLSDIDTTFAMYDAERDFGALPNNRFFSAVRSPEPYTARHLMWYNEQDISDEETYFIEHTSGYWSEKYKAWRQ